MFPASPAGLPLACGHAEVPPFPPPGWSDSCSGCLVGTRVKGSGPRRPESSRTASGGTHRYQVATVFQEDPQSDVCVFEAL